MGLPDMGSDVYGDQRLYPDPIQSVYGKRGKACFFFLHYPAGPVNGDSDFCLWARSSEHGNNRISCHGIHRDPDGTGTDFKGKRTGIVGKPYSNHAVADTAAFLYNTLTAIGCLCDIDSSRAKKAIIDFSEYLRGNLDSLSRTALIPFEKELSHISIYLSLEKMRFEEELTVQYDLTVKNFLLPPLTVQPLVENAVRHGISKKEDGGIIIIATKDTGKYIEITVTDNGAGFDMDKLDKEDRVHVGLQNVRKRLQIQCGGSLKIESSPGNGTRVTLAIPYDHPQVS